jgi:hypothetical protein
MDNTNNAPTAKVPFLKALFDFKFEQFIYIRVARVVYATLVILVLAAAAFLFIAALTTLGNSQLSGIGLLLLLGTPLTALLTIITLRLTFESGIALVVIAENTKKR